MSANLKQLFLRTLVFGLIAILSVIVFIGVFFSFGKIDFWIYNKTSKSVEINSCLFEGKKLSNCPSVIVEKGDAVSARFETETLFSPSTAKVYTLDLDLIIEGSKVKRSIKFRKQRGWCIEMISIAEQKKIDADTVCSNPFS